MHPHDIIRQLQAIQKEALAEIQSLSNRERLEDLRVKYFGRKNGQFTNAMKRITDCEEHARGEVGAVANEAKELIMNTLEEKLRARAKTGAELARDEWIDVTLPGAMPVRGHAHIVSQTIVEIEDIFSRIGFYRSEIPEADWDWYAFASLNFPKDHPARDEWETFFLTPDDRVPRKGRIVLTPHTSSGQVREMEKGKLPIRSIFISKCYRRQIDISHTPVFHQFEGLYVDKRVSITHLKGILDYFAQSYFGPKTKTRIRPFHFQFTEPSFEVDVTCALCGGKGCRYCKAGWSEIGGAGMVHPNVLRFGGVDPRRYAGFAFGWGVERVALSKPGRKIPDLRMLYQNDLRFIEQF